MQRMIIIGLALLITVACEKSRIEVQERSESIAQGSLDTNVDLAPIIENVPQGQSRITQLEVVVSGDWILNYIYKVGPEDQVDCQNATDYSINPAKEPIIKDISNLPDGAVTLCVVVQDDKSKWQDYKKAAKFVWLKETGALRSAENLRFISDKDKINLLWDDVEDSKGYLVVRSAKAIDWAPVDGISYELGMIEDVTVVGNDKTSLFEDLSITQSESYHYAVYTYDIEYRYSPGAKVSVVASADPFAWIELKEGAYVKNAIVAGTRFNGESELYLCRGERLDASGEVIDKLPGKFVPNTKGDPSTGVCYSPNRQKLDNFTVMVLVNGNFSDQLEWVPMSQGDAISPKAIPGGNEGETSLYICRFKNGASNYYTPGSVSVNQSCAVDAFGAPNSTLTAAEFEILLLR